MTTISFSQHLACLRVEVWTIMTTAISTLLFSQHLADSGVDHYDKLPFSQHFTDSSGDHSDKTSIFMTPHLFR